MKNLKKNPEKGSITLFVLIAIIFILIVISAVYFSSQNKASAQEREIKQIERSYNVDNQDLSDEYDKLVE